MLVSLKLRQKVKIASAHRFSCETIKALHPKTGSWSNADYCSNTNRGWDGGEKKHGTFEDVTPLLQPADRFRMSRVGVCLCGWGWGGRVLQPHLETLAWKWALSDAIKGESLPTAEVETGHRFPGKDRSTVSRTGADRVRFCWAGKNIPSCDPKDPSLNPSVNEAQPRFAPVLFAGCASLCKHTDQSPVCQRTAHSLLPCVLHCC